MEAADDENNRIITGIIIIVVIIIYYYCCCCVVVVLFFAPLLLPDSWLVLVSLLHVARPLPPNHPLLDETSRPSLGEKNNTRSFYLTLPTDHLPAYLPLPVASFSLIGHFVF